jgi:hypothetical protein
MVPPTSSCDSSLALAAAASKKRARIYTSPDKKEIMYATLVQRAYTHKLFVDANKFGMTSFLAKTISFDDLSARLRETVLIRTMKVVLHRTCVLTADGLRSSPDASEVKKVNVRVFLAAYMISYHAHKVFERIEKNESALIVASDEMLTVFGALRLAIENSKKCDSNKEAIQKALTFPMVLHTYLKAFQAWKLPDEEKIRDRIQHALDALHRSGDLLVGSDDDTIRIRAEFEAQIERFRSKLLQVAGEEVLKRSDALHATRFGTQIPAAVSVAMVASGTSPGTGGGYTALPRRMTNEELAHELMIDPSFTLDEHGGLKIQPVSSLQNTEYLISFTNFISSSTVSELVFLHEFYIFLNRF